MEWHGGNVTEPLPKPAGPPGSTGPAGNATTSLIFDTGGIDLVAGQEYVIFVSLPANHGLYYSYLEEGTGPGYTDGSTVTIDSDSPSDWTSQAWTVGEPTSSDPSLLTAAQSA
jgi:hypothetical protein